MNLKHPSHDWHVQPVVKDRTAFSALGGAFGQTTMQQAAPPVLEIVAISLGKLLQNSQRVTCPAPKRRLAREGDGLRLASLDADLLRSAISPAFSQCSDRARRG
jgi:hypothetical protein